MNGKLLKQKIQELNISQVDLAKRLGVTPQSLTAIFSAKDVRLGTIEKIAQVLDVSPVYFYNETASTNAESLINKGIQTINRGSNNTQIIHSSESDISLLKQRVADLEQIVFEKERLISILMKKR